jgi:hypothetical protein
MIQKLMMYRFKKCRSVLQAGIMFLVFLFACPGRSTAQDDHYWAQQYGAISTLMGGALVGGVNDNSAVYYNPAALSFINNPSLSIDANVYKMDKINIDDGAGEGMNLNSAQLSVYPQIISGMINLLKSDRFRFSYAILTRNHNNVLINARYTGKPDPGSPDTPPLPSVSFVGVYDYTNQLTEQWFGMGIGYKVSDKLGIGATFYSCYRGQSYRLNNYVREVSSLDSSYTYGTKTTDEALKYSTFRLIAKAGLSYIAGPWKLGLTLTTPSIGLYGSGSVQREISNIFVSENPDAEAQNFILADQQTGVKTNYRHPLSIGFGVDFHTDKTRIAFSAEYFFKIGTYHLMEATANPFLYPPSLQDSSTIRSQIDNFLHVENGAKPVFNAALGFSQVIHKNFSILIGASTDFSSYRSTTESKELLHGFSGFDMYHFSAGISYQRKKSTFSMGFTYAFSPAKLIPPYTLINQNIDFTGDARISSQMYAVVFGYTYFLPKFSE